MSNEPEPQDVPLPTPSLQTLISGIAAQAMVSMGVFPNPVTKKTSMMLHQAHHLVDTVALLVEKTRGNCSDDEAKMMEGVLHELRLLFVAARREAEKLGTAVTKDGA